MAEFMDAVEDLRAAVEESEDAIDAGVISDPLLVKFVRDLRIALDEYDRAGEEGA